MGLLVLLELLLGPGGLFHQIDGPGGLFASKWAFRAVLRVFIVRGEFRP